MDYKRKELLHYLQLYLSKKFHMEIVFIRIVDRLKTKKPISIKQFNSIIKFLERERKFISMNRDEIRFYFDSLITPTIQKENYVGNTLCKFM